MSDLPLAQTKQDDKLLNEYNDVYAHVSERIIYTSICAQFGSS